MLLIVAGFRVRWTWGVAAVGGSLVAFAVLLRALDVGSGAAALDASSEEALTGAPASGMGPR
jgi:hypothetical protein